MMLTLRHFAAMVAMLLAAGSAVAAASAPAPEWTSYRDAYRAMVVFEKYGKPKNYIQQHYQVMPREKGIGFEGVQLTVQGKTRQLVLLPDALGRVVFPFLKTAYDENAALVLNRTLASYVLRPRVSIVPRLDGQYDTAGLRAACEQALAWQRHIDARASARKCVGVRFAFSGATENPQVRLSTRSAGETAMPATWGAAFNDDPNEAFRVVDYRFAQRPLEGQLVTIDVPLAVAALIE